jgi:hypothetical protein
MDMNDQIVPLNWKPKDLWLEITKSSVDLCMQPSSLFHSLQQWSALEQLTLISEYPINATFLRHLPKLRTVYLEIPKTMIPDVLFQLSDDSRKHVSKITNLQVTPFARYRRSTRGNWKDYYMEGVVFRHVKTVYLENSLDFVIPFDPTGLWSEWFPNADVKWITTLGEIKRL